MQVELLNEQGEVASNYEVSEAVSVAHITRTWFTKLWWLFRLTPAKELVLKKIDSK